MEVAQLPFRLHTIIMLIGAQGSSKTKFALEYLMPGLKACETGAKKINISYIGFEQVATEFSGGVMPAKDSIELSQITDHVYDSIYGRLRSHTSYPVNSDFIILDTNGLDSNFRDAVLQIAEDNHYNVSVVMFNYDNKAAYTVQNHYEIKQVKRLLSGELPFKVFSSVRTLVTSDFDKYQIQVSDYEEVFKYMLPEDGEYVVIGDVHGCLEELKETIIQHGFVIGADMRVSHPAGKRIVLVGDLIDKGYAVAEVIDFVYANIDFFYMTIGNHENFVYKALKGLFDKSSFPSDEIVAEYFGTYLLLKDYVKPVEPVEPKIPVSSIEEPIGLAEMQKYEKRMKDYVGQKKRYDILLSEFEQYNSLSEDEKKKRKETREKFFKIFESMKSFLVHKDFIVTHAPCEKKYLGKLSDAALKATRDFRYPKMADFKLYSEFFYEFDERVSFLKEEANDSHPIHVFGHVMASEVGKFKNKINIDTGCVAHGSLTSVVIKNRKDITIHSVPASFKTHVAPLYKFF
jgi:hypothetical protein